MGKTWKKTAMLFSLFVMLLAVFPLGASADAISELQERVIRVYEEVAASVVHIAVRGTTEDVFMRPVPTSGSGSGLGSGTGFRCATRGSAFAWSYGRALDCDSVKTGRRG